METTYELHHNACTDRRCEGECLTKQDVVRWFFLHDDLLEAVKKLHNRKQYPKSKNVFCGECDQEWPCSTIQIVGEPNG